jgi:LysM repeat protein
MKPLIIFLVTIAFSTSVIAQTQSELLIVKKGEKELYLEHKVQAKEGLYAIGRLYNISPKHVAAFNKIDMNLGLNIDQVLMIPLSDTNFTQKSPSGTPVYYRVMSGDGLIKVSVDNNNVAMKSIREWNALANDNIQEGSNLIIGFLISKEMVAYLANIRAKNAELAKQAALRNDSLAAAQVVTDKPTVKTDVVTTVQKEDTPKVINAVVKEEVKPVATTDNSYFKLSFDQQIIKKPIAKSATVTSGIFKTNAGWQDAKYYLLIDGVTPGTVVKLINPDNNKTVYAKVLGEMAGIRQNQGLDIRISNAAASALQVSDEEKFVVKVNY